VSWPPSGQIHHLQCFTTRHRRCGPSDSACPPLPCLLSVCKPSLRALPKSHCLPRSTACTLSVRTPRSFPVPYPLLSCATMPRSVVERRLAAVPHHRGDGAASPSWLRSAPSARRAPRALERSVATAHHTVQPSVAVGHALLQQATPSTVLAGRALKPARGLCFIFLFSEYNQINANSKICTSFI
jgi:hypothetical protein